MRRPRGVVLAGMAVLAIAASSSIDLAHIFDRNTYDLERDGDVELKEVIAQFLGRLFAWLQYASSQSRNALSMGGTVIALIVGFLLGKAALTAFLVSADGMNLGTRTCDSVLTGQRPPFDSRPLAVARPVRLRAQRR